MCLLGESGACVSSRGNSTSQDDRSSEGRGNAGRVRANLRTVAACEKDGGNPTVPAGVRWAKFNREDWGRGRPCASSTLLHSPLRAPRPAPTPVVMHSSCPIERLRAGALREAAGMLVGRSSRNSGGVKCEVPPGSRGHVGRTPGMPLPVRNHPRVQRCEGHWSGGAGGSGHSPRLSCTRAPPVRTRKRRATPCARARGSARGRQTAPPLAVHAQKRSGLLSPKTSERLGERC